MAGVNNAVNDSRQSWFNRGLEAIGEIGNRALSIYGGFYEIKNAREAEKQKKAVSFAESEVEIADKIQRQEEAGIKNILFMGFVFLISILIIQRVVK